MSIRIEKNSFPAIAAGAVLAGAIGLGSALFAASRIPIVATGSPLVLSQTSDTPSSARSVEIGTPGGTGSAASSNAAPADSQVAAKSAGVSPASSPSPSPLAASASGPVETSVTASSVDPLDTWWIENENSLFDWAWGTAPFASIPGTQARWNEKQVRLDGAMSRLNAAEQKMEAHFNSLRAEVMDRFNAE